MDPRLINDLAGVITWQLDLATGLLSTDQQGYHLLGLPTQPLGWAVHEFTDRVHPDDLLALREANALSLATHGPVDVTLRVRGADGHWVHLLTRRIVQGDEQGQPRILQGIAFNVTQQQRLASELKTASDRIALAARGVGMGTWVLDIATGAHQWDAQMWALRGRTPRPEAPDYPEMLEWVHPDDRPRAERRLQQTATAREGQHEFRVIWPDGTVHWLASRRLVVRDDEGHAIQQMGVNWDVTDAGDRPLNMPLWGSMGAPVGMGLGLALVRSPPLHLAGTRIGTLAQAVYGRRDSPGLAPLGWGYAFAAALPGGGWRTANPGADEAQQAGLATVNSWLELKQAVLAGIGRASLWCFAADAEPSLERLSAPDPRHEATLWLVHRAKAPPGPALRAVIADLGRSIAARIGAASPPAEGGGGPL